jgi:hypothetical protein
MGVGGRRGTLDHGQQPAIRNVPMTLLLGVLFCFAPGIALAIGTLGGWRWLISTVPAES